MNYSPYLVTWAIGNDTVKPIFSLTLRLVNCANTGASGDRFDQGVDSKTMSGTFDNGNRSETRNQKIVAAIPCFNNQNTITDIVKRTKKYVDEVFVIDDGSTDKSASNAQIAGAMLLRHERNRGYGEAIKSCFTSALTAKADILVTIDGDGQHNPDEIPILLKPVCTNLADLVIGSRFLDYGRNIPRYRKFGIGLINKLWNIGSPLKLTDTQSGFRAYGKNLIQTMSFSEKGMSVSIDILEKVRRSENTVLEVPITCSYENNNSSLSIKAIRHGVIVALAILRIRLKTLFC